VRWRDLQPDPDIVEALAHAGDRPEDGHQNEKRRWSERFANGCAVAVAKRLRQSSVRSRSILPSSLEHGTEPLTPLGSGTSKRIDVTVVDAVLGLEIGVSLKGLNFRDVVSENYDKNLTGRLYELADEVRLVHEHLPNAFMVGIFFLPLSSAVDKIEGNSSFANTVMKLRGRTGRLDPALGAHASRCDAAYVGLYATGDEPGPFARGVARFTNVGRNPPRRGRPKVADTLSLAEVVAEFVAQATFTAGLEWAEAETDD